MTIFNFLNQTAFFMGTILVAVSCLIYSLAGHHTDRPQNNVFLISLLCLIVTAMCNIVCAAAASLPIPSRIARLMMETGNYIFFILHVMQSYLLAVCHQKLPARPRPGACGLCTAFGHHGSGDPDQSPDTLRLAYRRADPFCQGNR